MPVPGGELEEQVVRIAGVLAESGVQRLVWNSAGVLQEFVARETDLPGLLRDAPVGAFLVCEALGVAIHKSPDGLTWKGSTPDAAARFAERLG